MDVDVTALAEALCNELAEQADNEGGYTDITSIYEAVLDGIFDVERALRNALLKCAEASAKKGPPR